jgi:hypothetical protein
MTLSHISIQSGSINVPRGLSITAITDTIDSILLGEIRFGNPQPKTSVEFEFQPTTARLFRISQIGPNQKGKHFMVIAKIECFSPEPPFTDGVFRHLFQTNRTEITKCIEVTARFNQPDQLYRLDDTFDCYTGIQKDIPHWVEVRFTKGKLLISGYALRRRLGMELRSWSLIATNDSSSEEWITLHRLNDVPRDKHDSVEFFAIQSEREFSRFRLVNESLRWDGKPALHLDGFELFGTYRN